MKTMRKISLILTTIAVVLTTGVVRAQNAFNCGIEAGAVLSFPADHMKGTSAGWLAGVTGEYEIGGNWLVESALRLKSKPTDGRIAILSGAESDSYTLVSCLKTTPVYLELPIRAGYALILNDSFKLNISAGPYFGLGMFGKSKWTRLHHSNDGYAGDEFECDLFGKGENAYEGIMNRFEVGMSGKAVFRFKCHYAISLEYTRQFNPMYKKRGFSKMYNQTISFGLSYTM